jgi:hypothetical protein
MPSQDPLPTVDSLQLPTGYRPTSVGGVSLGNYSVGIQRPGAIYRNPKVSPKQASQQTAQAIGQLKDALIQGSLSGAKIWETTKNLRDKEDLEAIDEMVSGLTSEQALTFTRLGQEGIDQAVRRGEISQLANPENYKRLRTAIADRASVALISGIDADPAMNHRDRAAGMTLAGNLTPGTYLSGVMGAKLEGFDEESRAGILGSNVYKQYEARWISDVHTLAEQRHTQELVSGGVTQLVEGLRTNDPTVISDVSTSLSGLPNAPEHQLDALRKSLVALSREDPDGAVEMIGNLMETGGYTVGGTDISNDSYDGFLQEVVRSIEIEADRKERREREEDVKISKEAKRQNAGTYLAIQDSLGNDDKAEAESTYKEAYDVIRNSGTSEIEQTIQIKELRADYDSQLRSYETSKSMSEADKSRTKVAEAERLDEVLAKFNLGEADKADVDLALAETSSSSMRDEAIKRMRQSQSIRPEVRGQIHNNLSETVREYEAGLMGDLIATGELERDFEDKPIVTPEQQAEINAKGRTYEADLWKHLSTMPVDPEATLEDVGKIYTDEMNKFRGATSGGQEGAGEKKLSDAVLAHAKARAERDFVLREKLQAEGDKVRSELDQQYSTNLLAPGHRSKKTASAYRKALGSARKQNNEHLAEYGSYGLIDLDSYWPIDLYRDEATGIDTFIDSSDDTEQRRIVYGEGVRQAENTLDGLAGAINGSETTQAQYRIPGSLFSAKEFTQRLEPVVKAEATERYTAVRDRYVTVSYEEIRNGMDRRGMPVDKDKPLSEWKILDFKPGATLLEVTEDITAKANALGVHEDELIKAQSVFYGRLLLDNPDVEGLDQTLKEQREADIQVFDIISLLR